MQAGNGCAKGKNERELLLNLETHRRKNGLRSLKINRTLLSGWNLFVVLFCFVFIEYLLFWLKIRGLAVEK